MYQVGKESNIPFFRFQYLKTLPTALQAEVEVHLRQSGLPFATLRSCMFYDDFVNFPFLQPHADGTFVFYSNCGPAPHPWHCADDVGGCAAAIFESRSSEYAVHGMAGNSHLPTRRPFLSS
jgi:uncharacterized protein YbjT (DUF2867 family)